MNKRVARKIYGEFGGFQMFGNFSWFYWIFKKENARSLRKCFGEYKKYLDNN